MLALGMPQAIASSLDCRFVDRCGLANAAMLVGRRFLHRQETSNRFAGCKLSVRGATPAIRARVLAALVGCPAQVIESTAAVKAPLVSLAEALYAETGRAKGHDSRVANKIGRA